VTGKVYIVGAGPGAADLLTLRAANVLRNAAVVLHDDLVSPEVLNLIAPSAEVINVGKRCGKHSTSQEQINALMVFYARRDGTAVVRLKSGDPAIFGRLGEEIECLRHAEIPFEIVPGITAAHASAAAASLTLTDRRSASALVLLTAHHCANRPSKTWLDPAQTTYAVYMPGPDYGETASQLVRMGLDDATPCALVSNASSNQQQVRFLLLSELRFATAVAAPALLIAGEVARSRNEAELFPISELLATAGQQQPAFGM